MKAPTQPQRVAMMLIAAIFALLLSASADPLARELGAIYVGIGGLSIFSVLLGLWMERRS